MNEPELPIGTRFRITCIRHTFRRMLNNLIQALPQGKDFIPGSFKIILRNACPHKRSSCSKESIEWECTQKRRTYSTIQYTITCAFITCTLLFTYKISIHPMKGKTKPLSRKMNIKRQYYPGSCGQFPHSLLFTSIIPILFDK